MKLQSYLVSHKSTFSQNDIFVLFTCLGQQKHSMNDTLKCLHSLAISLNHLLTSVLCLPCCNAYLFSLSLLQYNSFTVIVKGFNSAKMLTNNGQDLGTVSLTFP